MKIGMRKTKQIDCNSPALRLNESRLGLGLRLRFRLGLVGSILKINPAKLEVYRLLI